MKVTFLGIGEAFDSVYSNTSLAIESRDKALLIDCGFSVVQKVWQNFANVDSIDFIYLTHWHADHCFGLPALLTRWWESDRKKEVIVCGQVGTKDFVKDLMELAYPGILKKIDWIKFYESDQNLQLEPFSLSFAQTSHSRKNLAIKLETKDNGRLKSVAFSGDGGLTKSTKEMFENVDLLIHETYFLEKSERGHASICDVVDYFRNSQIKKLAMLHLNRELANQNLFSTHPLCNIPREKILFPEQGATIWI